MSSIKETFYQILGVDRKASQTDIKKKYMRLALENHPDKTRDLPKAERVRREARFKQIGEVYNTLSDPDKRRQYDADLDNPRPSDFSSGFGHGFGHDFGHGFGHGRRRASSGDSGFGPDDAFWADLDPDDLDDHLRDWVRNNADLREKLNKTKWFGDGGRRSTHDTMQRGRSSFHEDFNFSDASFGHRSSLFEEWGNMPRGFQSYGCSTSQPSGRSRFEERGNHKSTPTTEENGATGGYVLNGSTSVWSFTLALSKKFSCAEPLPSWNYLDGRSGDKHTLVIKLKLNTSNIQLDEPDLMLKIDKMPADVEALTTYYRASTNRNVPASLHVVLKANPSIPDRGSEWKLGIYVDSSRYIPDDVKGSVQSHATYKQFCGPSLIPERALVMRRSGKWYEDEGMEHAQEVPLTGESRMVKDESGWVKYNRVRYTTN